MSSTSRDQGKQLPTRRKVHTSPAPASTEPHADSVQDIYDRTGCISCNLTDIHASSAPKPWTQADYLAVYPANHGFLDEQKNMYGVPEADATIDEVRKHQKVISLLEEAQTTPSPIRALNLMAFSDSIFQSDVECGGTMMNLLPYDVGLEGEHQRDPGVNMAVANSAKYRFLSWLEEEVKGLGTKDLENLCLYIRGVAYGMFEGFRIIRDMPEMLRKEALRDQSMGTR